MLKLIPPALLSRPAQTAGFVVGAIIISLATLTPIESLPPAPGSDKLHHILGFGGWALLCAFGPWRRFAIMALCIVLWGGMIELIQPSVNRYGEWLDFFANTLGVILVTIIRGFLQGKIARSQAN